MIKRDNRQNNKNKEIQEKHIKYLDKKTRVLFITKLEQMEIAYNNNDAKNFFIKK
jgi:hypothetical protein